MLVFQACKEKETETLSQMKEVMAIHDEVMPKMGTIGKLVAELKPKVDSTETGIAYDKAMKDLQEAHKSMMDWMKGFGDRFTSDEILNGAALTPQKQEWLNEEEEKVKALKLQINTSIENAEKLLE
jgi:predicted  nucleic acid-binding Zn-ribbon protein